MSNNKSIIKVQNLSKNYGNFKALENVDLEINRGEILALLGPNGAGKTTLISTICGLVNISKGTITINGYDSQKDYRKARANIGLVPQELTLGIFDIVQQTVKFSRGLYGKPADDKYIHQLLKELSLDDKKDNEIRALSGGMKRRVLIAKALSHQPDILFLDEPTAGVDVELRKDMWEVVKELQKKGVTIILTTHYIEEAEALADRIGVINEGKLILVEQKNQLMKKLGKHQLNVQLREPLSQIPKSLEPYQLELSEDGQHLSYTYDKNKEKNDFSFIINQLSKEKIYIKDMQTKSSSLEDIFIDLVKKSKQSNAKQKKDKGGSKNEN